MITRQLLSWLTHVSSRVQIVHIFGLRQTGKTTLMDQFRQGIPDHLHYPLQRYAVLHRYRSNVTQWVYEIEEALARVSEGKRLHVFVDEVQKST